MIRILELEHHTEEEDDLEVFVRNVHTLGATRWLVIFRGEGRAPHDYAYELKNRLSRRYQIDRSNIEHLLGITLTVSLGAVKACRTKNWNRPIPGQQNSQFARNAKRK